MNVIDIIFSSFLYSQNAWTDNKKALCITQRANISRYHLNLPYRCKHWYTAFIAVTGLPGLLTGFILSGNPSGMNSDFIFCRLSPYPTLCEKSAVLLVSINDLWVFIHLFSITQYFYLVKCHSHLFSDRTLKVSLHKAACQYHKRHFPRSFCRTRTTQTAS